MRYIAFMFVVLSLAFFLGAYPELIWAQEAEGHAHDQAEQHGGQATMTEEFHFEVLFHRDSLQLYLYDGKQNPISAKGVSGTVALSFREPGRDQITTDFVYVKPEEPQEEKGEHGHAEKGHDPQDFLEAKIDLAKVEEGSMKAVFVMKNLPGKKEKEITFRETFKLARLLEYVCPMKDSDPAAHPGKCKKCGMTLQRVAYVYNCPMHSKVTGRSETDKCWVCGMSLARPEDHHEETHEEQEKGEHDH